MSKQWYYVGNGERKGPMDESAIRALVEADVIRADTLMWSEGMPGWATAADSLDGMFPGRTSGFPAVPRQPQAFSAAPVTQAEPHRPQQMYTPQSAPAAAASANYLDEVGMGEATKRFFSNYANFSGRSSRGEYWWSVLGIILIAIVAFAVDLALILGANGVPFVGTILSLAILIPNLAIMVRRLHDLNKSGWWYFIGLVPLVGIILLLVWFCTEGDRQPNRFG